MLTVWSVLWGDKYHPGYVYALKEAVENNLSVPHRFKCLTDHSLPGIETVPAIMSWQGWWQKICLSSRDIAAGPCLYFDLDVVITGSLDYLVPYTEHQFAAPANWAQSGHGGIQSSVMAWNGKWHEPFNTLDYAIDSKRLWGDQEYLWELLGDDWVKVPRVASYKYHCRTGKPEQTSVIVFHGKPDPHEVKDPWILPFTATLRNLIRGNTGSGCDTASESTGWTSSSQQI